MVHCTLLIREKRSQVKRKYTMDAPFRRDHWGAESSTLVACLSLNSHVIVASRAAQMKTLKQKHLF